jgi:ATP-dependent DNA helicase RecG
MAVTVFKKTITKEKEKFSQSENEGVNEGVNSLLAIIKQNPGLRVPSLTQRASTSTKNIERWIKQLREVNDIEFRGASKTGGYFHVIKERHD